MIIDWKKVKIFIKPGTVDFRKQINGLSAVAEIDMKQDIFTGALFVFCSTDRKKLKVLYWDRTGFCLWHKRLEKDRFPWPETKDDALELTLDRFKLLLSGIDFFKAHKELKYQIPEKHK